MTISEDVIFFIHVIIIIGAILVPFIGNRQLLEMYSLFVPFIFFHWTVNDDTCALTKLEEYMTDEPKERTFMGRLVGPIYNVSDDEIGKLSSLQELDLSNNQIVNIPDTISKLKKLQILNLSKNQISIIPLASLEELTRLDLHSNQIKDIPEALFELKKLSYLDLSENQTAKIPPDILDSKDAKRIFNYLRNQNWISEARESLLNDESINAKAIFTFEDLSAS